jgi:RND family efflux transporter MFP subunit
VAGGLVLDSTAPEADQLAALGADEVLREVGVLRVGSVPVRTRAQVAGVLEPRRSVLLFAETRGPVIAVGAEELDRVEAHRVLLEIDPLLAEVAVERASAAVTRAESELALAKSKLDRRSSLAESGVASTSALDDAVNAQAVASAALREARAESRRARDDLAKKTIRAAFDGVLRSFDVEVGEYVQAGQRLGELLDTRAARVTVGLRDRDVVAVRPGQRVAVEVEAYPGENFEGEVLRVGAASDAVTKKFPVEVELPNKDGRLLPGMVATVTLDLGEPAERVLIPRDATLDEFGVRSVFVIEGQGRDSVPVVRRRRVGVRTVPFRPGEFEVVSGLDPGERIAVTATRQLRDGERVRLRPTSVR